MLLVYDGIMGKANRLQSELFKVMKPLTNYIFFRTTVILLCQPAKLRVSD